MDQSSPDFALSCPVPISQYPQVVMAHGGGGRLMNQLIEKMFVSTFGNAALDQRHDGARLESETGKIAFTTDSYVVRPLFFPGSDIGAMAVNGTVNDLAMCGAVPRWLSVGFIIEEGLPMETLWRVVQSMHRAATVARVQIVTGDTKVVDKGKGDGLFINTAGVGDLPELKAPIDARSVRAGDAVILSGDLGRHGMAIMSVREGLEFESPIQSDCAPLGDLVGDLVKAGVELHCLRDLTRGGLAAALNEIAATGEVRVDIDESRIPVEEPVRGACEILGLDPLYVANEGRLVAFVARDDADRAIEIMRGHEVGRNAGRIGEVFSSPSGQVTMRSRIGAARILDLLSGEQLPRIC